MRRAGGNRQCLPVPAGNEPREPGRTAKNTLLSSGVAAIRAPGLGVGLAARGNHRAMIGVPGLCWLPGGAEALRERVNPSGSSLLPGHPGAAPAAAQVSPGRPGWDAQQRQDIVLFHRSLPISMFLGAFSRRVLGRNLGLRGPAGAGSPRDTPPAGSRSEVTGCLSAALPQLCCLWSREFERKQ